MRMTAPVLFFAAVILMAQDDVSFKSETRLVQVYATVFDHGSKAVEGLTKDQFEIRDDGAMQPIRIFEASEKSISCALLLDTTGSMSDAIPALRNAARSFVESLRPIDSVGVYSFSDHVEELSEMSSDKPAARRALTRIRAGGRTALFDAITAIALKMERRAGKKVILVMTDGGDNASILNRQSAVERARKVGIPIFAIAEGEALKNAHSAQLLQELADATGGRMYKANHAKDMDGIFTDIAMDLEKGYLLAFQAPLEGTASKWHQLQISVKNSPKQFKVRARTGYSSE